jgi:hypothetical protein
MRPSADSYGAMTPLPMVRSERSAPKEGKGGGGKGGEKEGSGGSVHVGVSTSPVRPSNGPRISSVVVGW